jgi:hypothetical protein
MRTDQFGSFEYQRSLQHSFLLSNTNIKNLTKSTATHSISSQLPSRVGIGANSTDHIKNVLALNIVKAITSINQFPASRANQINITIAVTKHFHNTVLYVMSDRLITQANSRLTKANLVVSKQSVTDLTRWLTCFTDVAHQGGSLVLARFGYKTRAIPHAPSTSER